MPTLTRANYITLAAVGLLCLTLGLWLVVERMRAEPVEVLPVEVVGGAHGPVGCYTLEVGGTRTVECTDLGKIDSIQDRVMP